MGFNLLWDGSYLEQFNKAPWENSIRYLQRTYAFINTEDGWQVIQVVRTKNILPVIIDELADYFALPKRGTHTLHIKKTHYVIYYVPIDNDEISYETQLSKIEKQTKKELYENDMFTTILKNLFTLAYSLQLNLSESNIIVRKIYQDDKVLLIPMLFNYTKCKNKLNLPPRIRKKLFDHLDHNEIMSNLIDNNCDHHYLKIDIKELIDDIDNNYDWLAQIFNRSLENT